MPPIRVGFIGLSANKGWAVKTHLPAIAQNTDKFVVTALLNSTLESSLNTIKKFGLRATAFSSPTQFASYKEIDMIVVSIKVPEHYNTLVPVIEASYNNANLKYLYVEWALGNGLEQAEQLCQLAEARGIQTIISLQGRKSPYVIRSKKMIENGDIGEINSIEILANGGWYGYERPLKSPAYLYDINSGADLVTTAFGHTIDILMYLTGSYFGDFSAMIFNNIPKQALLDECGKRYDPPQYVEKTAPDHLLFQGYLSKGQVPVSVSFKGGSPAKRFTKNLVIDIHGTRGDIKLEGNSGFAEISNLVMYYCQHAKPEDTEIFHLPNYNSAVGNIEQLYLSIWEHHINHKERIGVQNFDLQGFPTFQDALILHKIIDSVFKKGVRP